MRAFNRVKARGFTLVELMIVVAIIGVLAALAIYGVRKYLASAKSAEAKNTIGAINRSAVSAYERENMASQLVVPGASGTGTSHALCLTATPVPAADASIQNKKYQPDTANGKDYNTGDQVTGWKCLRFQLTEPQYYRYAYTPAKMTITGIAAPIVPGTGWSAEARGDLNGDGVFSGFMLVGDISNGQPIVSTSIAEINPDD